MRKTEIYKGPARWGRAAVVWFEDNKVVFDCSDEEYGPIEFDTDLFVQAYQEHYDIDTESSIWDITLNDGLENEEWDEDHAHDMVMNDMVSDLSEEEIQSIIDESNLDLDGDGIISDEERAADTDGDGIISTEEYKDWYENKDGWRELYKGNDYWLHPNFDWSKRERWINNQNAIKHWVNNQGGSYTRANEYKKELSNKSIEKK